MTRSPARVVSLVFLALFLLVDHDRIIGQDDRPREPREARLEQLRKRFPDADANQDGQLTAEEAQAFRKSRRQNDATQKRPRQRPEPTHGDVAYGPHERNVLDLYLADSKMPTPLIVYIHGGGFVGGDKDSVSPGMIQAAHENNISVAALHYRFVDGEEILFPVPQHDCARAIQFLRQNADRWNLDPQDFACYGGSAGAGISMWLGFHDDLADPKSDDPMAQQSTRIDAIGTMGGQGTYDPIEIKNLVGGRAWEHPSIFKVYGVKSAEAALHPTPEMKKLYDEASAITHLSKDDPPLYMIYSEPDIVPPADSRPGQFIHHPNFGKQLKAAMDKLGIENVYVHTDDAKGRDPQMEMFEFFRKHFQED
ncbi:alpha/beta hydrolase [Roseiconus nitratireducens]|uniref:Alpha/beta hydrolase n=1 Tax=Roseiconus nitratireducens TaxID=2605748 RepID=A0A5M6CYG2_9BACT|nr:alpha/beta hydrolase [Roseiconus nitratireducens]KAA5539460.1 alpha/beta hydrolase [Roseiconus nitratireducens]